jgi:uncharacterized membrane protein
MGRDPDLVVSRVLRAGLFVSIGLLAAGSIGHVVDQQPIGAFSGAALTGGHGWPAALLWWGLTVLVLTPIARIVSTVIAYGHAPAPQRRFAFIAAASLAVIGLGVLLGQAPL